MTDPSVDLWLAAVTSLPGHDRSLRILVLADPGAVTCRALAAAGHDVACCPDLQTTPGGDPHVGVMCVSVADLMRTDRSFDVIVGMRGWQRLLAVTTPEGVASLVEWLRGHATVFVAQAPRRALAADLNDLGPFEVLPLLGAFDFLSEVPTGLQATESSPVVLASDHALLAGGTWLGAADVEWVDVAAPDARTKPVRTYLATGDRVVKVECTSEEYFERAQVVGEAVFLDSVDDDVRARLGLPRVRALTRGRAIATLVRDAVPDDGPPAALDDRLRGIVDACVAFAEVGLFHNDVRPWNVLWDQRVARFVDFADSSPHDDDVRDLPQVLALAGTLAAVATDEIRGGEHFHLDVLDVAARAGLLDRWPLRAQVGAPWLSLPRRGDRIDVTAGMTAPQLMAAVLEVTCG